MRRILDNWNFPNLCLISWLLLWKSGKDRRWKENWNFCKIKISSFFDVDNFEIYCICYDIGSVPCFWLLGLEEKKISMGSQLPRELNLHPLGWKANSQPLDHQGGPRKYFCLDYNTLKVGPWASAVVQTVKNLPAMQETWVPSLGQEDPLEKGMATHSSILAWRIPWTEELGRLQSMGSQRVVHDWATNTHTHTKAGPKEATQLCLVGDAQWAREWSQRQLSSLIPGTVPLPSTLSHSLKLPVNFHSNRNRHCLSINIFNSIQTKQVFKKLTSARIPALIGEPLSIRGLRKDSHENDAFHPPPAPTPTPEQRHWAEMCLPHRKWDSVSLDLGKVESFKSCN